ncbi:MAG: hypothetical protein IJY42_06360 [Clostridia bacterium]|nr:hypothetical protein [Clostridia bacterium]
MNPIDGNLPKTAASKNSPLRQACREGTLDRKLEEYLSLCRQVPVEGGSKKESFRFPNAAGFCRYMSTGLSELEELAKEDPTAYERLCTVLEDEALNSSLSPTLLSAYLKKRLGYEQEKKRKEIKEGEGQMTIRFEHDIWEDGQ